MGGKGTRLSFLHFSAHGKCLNLSFLFYFALVMGGLNEGDCLFFILVLIGNA